MATARKKGVEIAIKLVNQPCLAKERREEREKRKGEDWGEDKQRKGK